MVEIMGVLNITPDSFSDGGKFVEVQNATKQAQNLVDDGANIIDIGAESSKPFAEVVSQELELSRLIPIVENIKKTMPKAFISIDTYKPQVMQKMLDLGVDMINDIYALRQDGAKEVMQNSDCKICLMHMQGSPQTMQNTPKYHNIIDEIKNFFQQRLDECSKYGIDLSRVTLDPGFGFGKTYEHNILILKNLASFQEFGLKILVGLSKKSMFDTMLGGRNADGRITASTVAAGIAVDNGADIIRTHNPLEVSDMLKVKKAIYG